MPYYPLSQLKTNLYTKGGEYLIVNTNEEYKGYYYITSKGKAYTGKTPEDKPNILLLPIKVSIDDLSPEGIIASNKDTFFTIQNPFYTKILNPSGKGPSLPSSIYPSPTPNNYKLGEFDRYFLSKINEIKYLEVNQETYNKYTNKSQDVSYQLYSPFKLSWELTGDRKKVYKVNLNTVKRIERDLQLRGFIQYFKGRFTQFYKEVGS